MIKIEDSNVRQKVCDSCGNNDDVKFIKVGEPEEMRSFALCRKCREYLCKIVKNGES